MILWILFLLKLVVFINCCVIMIIFFFIFIIVPACFRAFSFSFDLASSRDWFVHFKLWGPRCDFIYLCVEVISILAVFMLFNGGFIIVIFMIDVIVIYIFSFNVLFIQWPWAISSSLFILIFICYKLNFVFSFFNLQCIFSDSFCILVQI